jgi:hypothetical protein
MKNSEQLEKVMWGKIILRRTIIKVKGKLGMTIKSPKPNDAVVRILQGNMAYSVRGFNFQVSNDCVCAPVGPSSSASFL